MSDMTPEKAKELRRQFPRESVGRLPKGGAMLDYVGHAAVTDRLLSVDPQWSWEPFAVDANGLPALDRSGNLWIKLTVCGVTRIGVGDGKNAKEIVGDALRNAAMRFGVALDLWSKEELEQGHLPEPPDPPRQAPTAAPAPHDDVKQAKDRVWRLAARFKGDATERKAYIAAALTARGFSADNADHLTHLADEWEQAA